MGETTTEQTENTEEVPVTTEVPVTEVTPVQTETTTMVYPDEPDEPTHPKKAVTKAELAERVNELEAQIGTLPEGVHPDEIKPRAATWLLERENWQKETEALRLALQSAESTIAAGMKSQPVALPANISVGLPTIYPVIDPYSPTKTVQVAGEISGLVNGRVVYYTPFEGEGFTGLTENEPICGMITRVWDKVSGCSNIRLLCDGETQNPQGLREWVTSRTFNAAGVPGTWRFTR